MSSKIILTSEEIKQLTWRLVSLSQFQREALRSKLLPLAGREIYKKELLQVLIILRKEGILSKIDFAEAKEALTRLFE